MYIAICGYKEQHKRDFDASSYTAMVSSLQNYAISIIP